MSGRRQGWPEQCRLVEDAMDGAGLVVDAATRILRDVCDPRTVNAAKDEGWKGPAWTALEEAGLTLAWVPEELGGAGASLADGFAVLREAGRFAIAVPLAETLLAGWLLSRAGLRAPWGPMSCGPTREGDRVRLTGDGVLEGELRAVPYAADAGHLAVLAHSDDGQCAVALVERSAARVREGASIAGDPLDAVSVDGVRPMALVEAPEDEGALMAMGAVVRSVEMAGALEAILELTVAYANERVAFERPIGRFQAVQHNLARLAGETAAALAAAGSAADAIASVEGNRVAFDDGLLLEVGAAKVRVGEAAREGAAIAHQVMGAIGFTREHVLHRFTRRLWAWRDDFGSESHWAVRLGRLVAARGADDLWPLLAAR